tara:strand:- start:161 stop:751 length:591 start_codon:yes stop_codon:yes gene_type:complete
MRKPDYKKKRPFENEKKYTSESLLELAEKELSLKRLEVPSLLFYEFSKRNEKESNQKLNQLFIKYKRMPMKWLQKARLLLLDNFLLEDTGRHHIYIIRLDFLGSKDDKRYPYGIYIGETKRKIEVRLSQHLCKSHKYSVGVVERRGQEGEILWSLFTHIALPKNRKEGKKLEEDVANFLKEASIYGLPEKRIYGGH